MKESNVKVIRRKNSPMNISFVNVVCSSHPVVVNPLGISVLAGYLRKVYQDKIRIYLHCSQFERIEDIIERVRIEQPMIVGLSLQMGSHDRLDEIMKGIQSLRYSFNKQPLIVLGNVVATFAPKDLLDKYPEVLLVIGEGEDALREIVKKVMDDRNDYEGIPNLMFKKGNEIIETRRQAFNIKDVAVQAVDFINRVTGDDGHVWMEASRGCNSRCTFCSRYPIRNGGWSPISVIKVLDEIHLLATRFGVKHFRFSDDDFMGYGSDEGEKHAKMIAEGLIAMGLEITFDVSARVKSIYSGNASLEENKKKGETLKLLKKAGLTQIFLGIESGSNKQLKRFGKGVVVEENTKAIKILLDLDIQVVMGFITMDYLMDLEELEENVQFLNKVGALDENTKVFVSDPLTTLRAQEGSSYIRLLENNLCLRSREECLLTYRGVYKDKRVGAIAELTEKWKKDTFSMIYSLKNIVSKLSMEEANGEERNVLEGFLYKFKITDYYYLIELIDIVKKNKEIEQDELDLVVDEFKCRRWKLIKELKSYINEEVKNLRSDLERQMSSTLLRLRVPS